MSPKRSFGLAILLTTALLSAAIACQVPVFRYALERWDADLYQVFVLHDGSLSEEDEQAIKILRKAEASNEGRTRFRLNSVTIGECKDPRLLQAWHRRDDSTTALLVAFYPQENDAPADPAFAGKLTDESANSLLESPARKAIAERLQSGESAVWIFVQSGNKAIDLSAFEALQEQIKSDADWLELPSAEELEVQPEVLTQCKIKLKIDFSILTVQPDDPAEKFFLDSLLNSESDLRSFEGPFAFPVFGRGRVLYGLVGKGIASDTIRSASSFMAGPCSCQVKNQNPGFDLLLMTDWEKAVGDTLISEPIDVPSGEILEPKLLTIPPGRGTR